MMLTIGINIENILKQRIKYTISYKQKAFERSYFVDHTLKVRRESKKYDDISIPGEGAPKFIDAHIEIAQPKKNIWEVEVDTIYKKNITSRSSWSSQLSYPSPFHMVSSSQVIGKYRFNEHHRI